MKYVVGKLTTGRIKHFAWTEKYLGFSFPQSYILSNFRTEKWTATILPSSYLQ